MDNNKIELIGAPCGHHGPYTFYKAFKYRKNGKLKILALSDFFFVKLWSDSDLMSIGELQLLWIDKNSEQVLASLRLYFLPENTPEGRSDDHGEDEVLAISEKVVLRVVDLLDWITEEAHWARGMVAIWDQDCPGAKCNDAATASAAAMLVDSALDFQDVNKEKHSLESADPEMSAVVVLSFPRYCRYRGIMKRLEGVTNKWLHNALVMALGGFAVPCRNTRILFCKETFDYPDLEGHEQLCNHLAPNLKGRPRRKRKKRSLSPGGSESNESESSLSTVSSSVKGKQPLAPPQPPEESQEPPQAPGGQQDEPQQPVRRRRATLALSRKNNIMLGRKSARMRGPPSREEKDFIEKLAKFIESNQTSPSDKPQQLGLKQCELNLFALYHKVRILGGYNIVTDNKQWKSVYTELGYDKRSTSAATCTRRIYERLLLEFEKHEREIKGEEYFSSTNELTLKEEKKNSKLNNQASTSRLNNSVAKLSPTKSRGPKPHGSASAATESKPSSVAEEFKEVEAKRKMRTKQSQEVTSPPSTMPGGKENIPVASNGSEESAESKSKPSISKVEKTDLEVADLGDDSPVKIGKTTVPSVKKRKLDILKEGGLEVTAITSPPATTSERRPSVIQLATAPPIQPSDNQVSITVTPDVSHLLGSPSKDLSSTPSPSFSCDSPTQSQQSSSSSQDYNRSVSIYTSPEARRSRPSWTPPNVLQSSSMYARSKSTVYGNPKEQIEPPRRIATPLSIIPRPSGMAKDEVLDLRVKSIQKPVVTLSRVTANSASRQDTAKILPRTSNSSASGRTVIGTLGSNLEITVVDVSKTGSNSSSPRNQLPQPSSSQQNLALLKHSQLQQKLAAAASSKLLASNRLSNSRSENGKYNNYVYNNQPSHHRNSTSATNGGNSHLAVPNYGSTSSSGRGGSRLHQQLPSSSVASNAVPSNPFLAGAGSPQLFPNYLPSSSASGNGAKPYLPMLDPLYYASLYNSPSLYTPYSAANFIQPSLFSPSPEQIQLYKDLVNQNRNNLRYSQANNMVANFLGLPTDGSTSITPVNHSSNLAPK